MRRTGLLVTALGACVGFAPSVAAQDAGNLVNNGSFEGATGVPPTGWTVTGTAGDGYIPVAIAYGQASGYPNGAQGEIVPQDNAVSQSPDAAGRNGVYFVSDAAVNLTLTQRIYLTAGAHAIGFDSYDTYNGAVQTYDAELTAKIAGVTLADFKASTVTPGIWTNHSGVAYVTQAGYYDVSFVFNANTFPAKDFVIDRAYVIAVDGTGGIPIGSFTFDHWDGAAAGNASNGAVDGGGGVWNATNANWTTATGSTNGAYSPNPTNAVFAGSPGTVTVDNGAGQIAVSGLAFNVDGYRLTGGAIQVAGANVTVAVGNGAASGAGYTATIDAPLTGSAGLTKTDAGTLILSAMNTYTGGTTVAQGALIAPAQSLGGGGVTIAQPGTLVINQPVNAALANVIAGSGALIKTGAGTLTLSGASPFSGATTVSGGTLAVTGSLVSPVTVNSGAAITISGATGGLAIAGGGLAQGSGAGLMTVNGAASFAAGSTYAIGINAAGASDRIAATGAATLTGGTVQVQVSPGAYKGGTAYTILSAQGGVTGRFSTLNIPVISVLLTPSLVYSANTVQLTLARTLLTGGTFNESALAGALNADPLTSPLLTALTANGLPTNAQLDQASGELHATLRSVLLDDGKLVREAVLDRLDTAATQPGAPAGVALWGDVRGDRLTLSGDGNAARARANGQAIVLGADLGIGAWRIGAAYASNWGHAYVPARASSAKWDGDSVAAYAGGAAGPFALRAGGSYTWYRLSTERSPALTPGATAQQAYGRYGARLGQLFAEGAFGLVAGPARAELFGRWTGLRLTTDGFAEQGGVDALTGAARRNQLSYSLAGARGTLPLGERTGLTLSGAWAHAFGGITPAAQLTDGSGSGFTLLGAPLARDAARVSAALSTRLGAHATLRIGYAGDLGGGVTDHRVNAGMVVTF